MLSSDDIKQCHTDVAENGKNVVEQGNPPKMTQEFRLVNDDNRSRVL